MSQLFPHERDALEKQLEAAIDEYCKVTYDDGHRWHLGASLIGDVCNRRLWYVFRWVKAWSATDKDGNDNSGQMQRLFNRGHQTEARFIEWLRGIGIQVWDFDDDGNQFRVKGVEGHFGGSLDSKALYAGQQFPLLAKIGPFLVEYKTHNAKSFAKLLKEGVKKSKPRHWWQMCTYGSYYGFRYALYCAINKDTDEIKLFVIELDWNVGTQALHKATDVVLSQQPPPRFSELPSHIECKFCDFLTVCHKGAPYDRNCRSCKFAQPIKGGSWWCNGWNRELTRDVVENQIPQGCPNWQPVGRS
jgi:hypothetical protein